jgi:hypothetical protein
LRSLQKKRSIMVKIGGISIILVALLASLPTPVESQADPQPEHQSAESVGSRHSPALAGVLEYLIPTVGHAYAGDWGRGIVPNVVRIGGLVVAVAGMEEKESVYLFAPKLECTTVCAIGIGVGLVGTVWAVWSAVKTANEINDKRSTGPLTLTLSPAPGGGFLIGGQIRR